MKLTAEGTQFFVCFLVAAGSRLFLAECLLNLSQHKPGLVVDDRSLGFTESSQGAETCFLAVSQVTAPKIQLRQQEFAESCFGTQF